MKQVTLLVNGPGELWGWCRPLTKSLKQMAYQVTIWLLPCQFSTGREMEVALRLGADVVVGPLSAGATLAAFHHHNTDIVIQLGGDLVFGRILARQNKSPLLCYTYGGKKGLQRCDSVLTAFQAMADTLPQKTVVVGDLVQEGLAMDSGLSPWQRKDGVKIAFFPGSRPAIRSRALPFLSEVRSFLSKRIKNLQVATLLSPFAHVEELNAWKKQGLNPTCTGTAVALREADLALTQPGTNTLELMYMGIPTLVAVPFAFLQVIPLSGLVGLTAALPVVGPVLKEKVLRSMARRRTYYVAWPNRLAHRQIMKETVGELTPNEVALQLVSLYEDRESYEAQRMLLHHWANLAPKKPSQVICSIVERLCVCS
ncbi:cdisaccharide synthetase [Aminobacterium sp. UBA5514]|uniref:cdisaccharide synthetase n=1 Tax=Aminobacterium sp. UBA5514 TaxID=1946036 RepID=UPI00257BC8BF|nr:cdisaccharide synthetase [Aminobacterium sp. UBA5514]